MKFLRPEIYNTWTPEQTRERIDFVMGEIKAFNQELNGIDSRVNELRERKKVIGKKVSNKIKYINQLRRQMLEFEDEGEWKEV